MDTITADNISFKYYSETKSTEIWNNLSLRINSGEVTSVLGISGVGKTTLLRVLSGLNLPEAGLIMLNNQPIKQPHSPIFFVFQDYNSTILPWLRVKENILLGDYKSGHKSSQKDLHKIVSILFKEFESDKNGFLNKFPHNLSGGQRQRIQIARALMSKAKFIFFDEPDSAVDLQVKIEIRKILYDLAYTENIGIVLVTHDLDNAIELSKKVYILVKKGLYEYEKSKFMSDDSLESSHRFKEKLLTHFKHHSL